MSLTRTRLASSAVLTCAAFAVALPGCTSDQSEPAGIGNVDMTVTLATPPSGPNEQIDDVFVSLYCDGIDPVLGVPRPPQSTPEEFTINVATTEGSEPYNAFGFFEKQGLPAGKCTFTFLAESNTGNTTCTGKLEVMVAADATTDGEVVLACIHTPRYGGVRGDGSFNQCAEYRQILVTPTTQSIGNLVDVRTEVYDPDGDDVTVEVTTTGVCGNVATVGSDEAASCGANISGCEAVVNTVQCTDVGMCQIIVRVSDDEFQSCTGFLPDDDNSNNNAARSIIDVDCEAARACGDGEIVPPEECEPPGTAFCDDNCRFIDPCAAPDACDQSNECSPEVCSADPDDNSAVCTPDPQTGGSCDLGGGESGSCVAGVCVACVNDIDCDDGEACTDDICDVGTCVSTPNADNECTDGDFPGNCTAAGVCEGLCEDVTCPDNGIECVTDVCNPENGGCEPTNDGINTGCSLNGADGVCDNQDPANCVECNIDAQCDEAAGETCNAGVCEAPVIVCEYAQNFTDLGLPADDPAAITNDGWLFFGAVFNAGGAFLFPYGPGGAPNGGPGFSAVVDDQGGTEQDPKQLSIYNDYNCCQPNNGHFPVGTGTDQVESSVFQEPRPAPPGGSPGTGILAEDIGKIVTFTFQAKRGNINSPTDPTAEGKCDPQSPNFTTNPPCDSTALAYIQTLDPVAGFNRTNFETLDMTNIPDTWNSYSISLDLSDPLLEGQVLQFGFRTVANGFEPSGIFYDNLTFGLQDCGGGGGPGIELRPLPEIYTTGKAINYSAFRAGGPSAGEIPNEADIRQDLGLLQTAGFNLVRLFGVDEVSGAEKILQLAAADFPEMRFQQGLFLGGLSASEAASCSNGFNDDQVDNAIRLANTYDNVVTVSVGNETSFFAPFMPLNCLEGYITETRNNVTQPVTADDDYTFYANFFGRSPDEVLRRIDFVSIHTYPFLNYTQWDWRQLGVTSGPLRAEAMMDASLAKAQDNYQVVYDYRYRNASGVTVTVGESLPIVIGETGWKWRQTNSGQEIETYAANPVNAKWYYDLMRSWERSPNGPRTNFIFAAFDEAWKQEFNDDGWGFWDEDRMPNYVLCDTPVPGAPPCNDPLYDGAGFFTP